MCPVVWERLWGEAGVGAAAHPPHPTLTTGLRKDALETVAVNSEVLCHAVLKMMTGPQTLSLSYSLPVSLTAAHKGIFF